MREAVDGETMRSSRVVLVIAAVAIAAAAVALWLFPRALPIIAVEQTLTRDGALARADSFFRAHALAPAGARTVVRFEANDSLTTFVELAGGGHDSLDALVHGRDIAPFLWSVRAFVPGNAREARVSFAPDGRVVGFARTLAEADTRPEITADSGQRLAEQALGSWINDRVDRWHLVTSSYETKKTSGRVDRTYTFERVDRRVGGAPIRASVVIAGDTPASVRSFVDIPESFERRYGEMRSANDLLALLATLAFLGVAIVGIVFLYRAAREKNVRWREPMIVGVIVGALALVAGLNEVPGSWYRYDTATSPASFEALLALGALAIGAVTMLQVGFTLAAAEAATRRAFPRHLDWWKLWKYRGTREVAARVGGGYAAACIAFAYVAAFYLVTRTLLGWWVPSDMLDNPNLIASPLPWISGIAASVNAGVWEEAMFRALPLALLALWVGDRPTRKWWMAAGVVGSALIFGFAHSNYDSWPPYSRGVEIFLDACFWGVLFINFGLIVTVVTHFVYDLVLFGLFAATGHAIEYRVSAAIIALALLAPAIAVVVQWVRQRGLVPAPDDAQFAAWTPVVSIEPAAAPVQQHAYVLSRRARQLAVASIVLGAIVAIAIPRQPTLGPAFTAGRETVLRTADSVLRARGGDPSTWKRLTSTGDDSLTAWPRFVRENTLMPRAQELAATYNPPTWWVVRYVHTAGTAAERADEWRVRLWPDGRPLDARHLIPDSATRNSAQPADVRRIALKALAQQGVNTSTLQESEYKETARPARRDVTVTYTDTAIKLPGGAVARAFVQVAGDEPLVARRRLELPETFLRADRERQTNRMIVGGLGALLLIVGFVAGAIIVVRRRPPVLDADTPGRRGTIALVAALAVLAAIEQLNGLPSRLFSYDTAEPWSRFVETVGLGFVGVIAIGLFVVGMWLALAALRRRVGIPMLAGGATRNDMLIAGLGLGSIVFAMGRLDALLPQTGMPKPPTTLLDQALPVLGELANVPAGALITVALIAIPILVVAGITGRWSLRALIAIVIAALIGSIAYALAPPSDGGALQVVAGIAELLVVLSALYFWGSVGAWSWIVAALAQRGLGELRVAIHAATGQEQFAGALGFVVIAGLVGLVAREVRKTPSTQ